MTQTVVHYTDATAFGGAERAMLTLCAELRSAGWRQLVIRAVDAPPELLEQSAALGIESLPIPGTRDRSLRKSMGNLLRLVQILKAEQATVLHAHLPWPLRCSLGLTAGMLARTPGVIATQHLYRRLSLAKRLRQRALSYGVQRYIAVSQAMADEMVKDRVVPAGKLRVIRNCIPVPGPNLPHSRLELDFTNGQGAPVVLTLARLDRQKGLTILLQAAKLVPNAMFLIAGEGPERAALEALRTELNLEGRVRFLGQRDDVPELLDHCDLFVLPSLFEGLPLSLLEAMAAGKPIVASAIPGTLETVTDEETALLAPPGDAAALAARIRRLLADKVLATRLGRAGQTHVWQHFSPERMTEEVQALYLEVIEHRRHRR